MAGLTCDVCGGKLVMGSGGIATCTNCGVEYNADRVREKFYEINGTAGLNPSYAGDEVWGTGEAGHRKAGMVIRIAVVFAVAAGLFAAVYFGFCAQGGGLFHRHTYTVTASQVATCESDGFTDYLCSDCEYSYRDVKEKGHVYTPATCVQASTCTRCGQVSGSALGHETDGVKCSRCSEITFQPLTYTGTGSTVIDYSLPSGKFKVTATLVSGPQFASMDVKVHHSSSFADTYELMYLFNVGESEIEYIYGPQTAGSIVVNASDDYWGNSSWIIVIEAVD